MADDLRAVLADLVTLCERYYDELADHNRRPHGATPPILARARALLAHTPPAGERGEPDYEGAYTCLRTRVQDVVDDLLRDKPTGDRSDWRAWLQFALDEAEVGWFLDPRPVPRGATCWHDDNPGECPHCAAALEGHTYRPTHWREESEAGAYCGGCLDLWPCGRAAGECVFCGGPVRGEDPRWSCGGRVAHTGCVTNRVYEPAPEPEPSGVGGAADPWELLEAITLGFRGWLLGTDRADALSLPCIVQAQNALAARPEGFNPRRSLREAMDAAADPWAALEWVARRYADADATTAYTIDWQTVAEDMCDEARETLRSRPGAAGKGP